MVGDRNEIWHKGNLWGGDDARTLNTRIAYARAEKTRDTTLDDEK